MTRFLFAALGLVRFCLMHRLARPWAVILLATMAPASLAEPIDPHTLFETRCGRCHDHAGDLARETLIIENGELVSKKNGRRLLDFLPGHFGKLTDDEISVLSEVFQRQVESGGLYQEKCRHCHEPARILANRNLILHDGELFGRYTDDDIKRVLTYHGRLSEVEQTIIYDMLIWQLTRFEGRDADKRVSSDGLQ